MKYRWLIALCVAALLAVTGGCREHSSAPQDAAATDEPLVVFAAASLKESMDEAVQAFENNTGQPIRVSYAGSSTLARQVARGAPADVFVSADQAWMDFLQQRDLIDTASRRDLLGNRLVLVAPASSTATLFELKPGVRLAPLLGDDGRIAVALTDAVPAGKYARAALTSLGLWPALQPRLAQAENVRAALMLVARGEAPLGIVYTTDALVEPGVRVLATFPADSHPPIIYPVATIAASRHPHAHDFVDWLGSADAAAIFRKHGFKVRTPNGG